MSGTASEIGRRSRRKGKTGEREVAAILRKHGMTARRAQQYSGLGSGDVVIEEGPLAGLHVEVKRTEKPSVSAWREQARRDAAGKPWVVLWRPSREAWLAILDLDTLLTLVRSTP